MGVLVLDLSCRLVMNREWCFVLKETLTVSGRQIIIQQFTFSIPKGQWIVPQFLNLHPKMAKSIVYVITLITNRNHALHCLN